MSPALVRFAPLTISGLAADYAAGRDPREVLAEVYRRIVERGDDAVWIHLAPLEEVLAHLPTDRGLPLFGQPFAIKDSIDVAGWPTTVGCPDYAYVADRDADCVARLRAAGAIPIGKTNLDQFATGLVGTRTPYGIPRSVFDDRYISGGSSSGSAVAVAAGLVPFALGTDTAGSGRVPAAFNNIVGLKPTRGLISTEGLVPACRTLDCITLFANNVADAECACSYAAQHDPPCRAAGAQTHRIGVPRELEFFGDKAAEELFEQACERFEDLGFTLVDVDFTPFREVAKLLYAGPWVAERLAAIEPFFQKNADKMDPVVREIIGGSAKYTAVDAYRGLYELERLRALAHHEFERMDVLLLPTTGTTYTVEEILADPVRLNSNLGTYTNFVNLLDMCGIAIPAGFRETNGLPFGITVLAPGRHDARIGRLARQFLGESLPELACTNVELAVVGAHLSGQPLNRQLTERAGRLIRTCRTAAGYRLYALANTVPPKPGLVREPGFEGEGIEVEVWSLSPTALGDFVAHVPAPMTIGTVTLEDGSTCKGFLCEPCAVGGATEITQYGGWRSFLANRGKQ